MPKTWDHTTRQLWYPFAGLRYVYFIDATSKRKPWLNRRIRIDVFAHAIGEPANDYRKATHWGSEQTIHRDSFGGRVGFTMPTCLEGRCASIGLTVGYMPMSGSVILEFALGSS